MAGNDRVESKNERASESDQSVTRTSAHVANESIADDEQAQRYEPKFKSFSGTKERRLHSVGDDTTNGVSASHCAEFVLEDKDAGTEYVAEGQRYVPRRSFIDGLKSLMDKAQSPEEAEHLQGAFSLEYMMRKVQNLMGNALSVFIPSELSQGKSHCSNIDPAPEAQSTHSNGDRTFSNVEDYIHAVKRTPDSRLVADSNQVASDAMSVPPPRIPPPEGLARYADLDLAGKVGIDGFLTSDLSKTTAPREIYAVAAHCVPGKVLEPTVFGLPVSENDEISYDKFRQKVSTGLKHHCSEFPNALPLMILVACESGVDAKDRASVAERFARDEKVYVLGSMDIMQQPVTAKQWRDVQEIVRQDMRNGK